MRHFLGGKSTSNLTGKPDLFQETTSSRPFSCNKADKEVDPIPGSLLCASNGTAVDHLDAVVVADEEWVFH
jgi:hypothetical protein